MGRFAAFLAFAAVGSCWLGSQPAEAVILINEVLADPSAVFGDANGDGVIHATQDEFVELVNAGGDPVSLASWTLADLTGIRHTFSLASTVPGFGFFVVFGGGSPAGFANVSVASTGTLGLNNTGDTITLRDASATILGSLSYGAEGGHDVSLTRVPDAVGGFAQHSTVSARAFSPGATVDGRTSLAPPPAHSPAIPEPSSLMLLGVGCWGLVGSRRK